MEQREKQEKIIRKLKKQLKFYIKKVEEFEGNYIKLTVFAHKCTYPIIAHVVSHLRLASAQRKKSTSVNAPVRVVNIARKEKEYRGMLKYMDGDESRLLKNLVTGVYYLGKLFFFDS